MKMFKKAVGILIFLPMHIIQGSGECMPCDRETQHEADGEGAKHYMHRRW